MRPVDFSIASRTIANDEIVDGLKSGSSILMVVFNSYKKPSKGSAVFTVIVFDECGEPVSSQDFSIDPDESFTEESNSGTQSKWLKFDFTKAAKLVRGYIKVQANVKVVNVSSSDAGAPAFGVSADIQFIVIAKGKDEI